MRMVERFGLSLNKRSGVKGLQNLNRLSDSLNIGFCLCVFVGDNHFY